MNVLITGANGFIGSAIIEKLLSSYECSIYAAVRKSQHRITLKAKTFQVGDLEPNTDWNLALQGVAVVIHTAARVHVMNEDMIDPLKEFRRVNVQGTLNLARQAAKAGVKRFIFISSIKVNGEKTLAGKSFQADDRPAPSDPYGISKMEAEQELLHLGREKGMEIVSIRPPLVYGPNVKANFKNMLTWLNRGVPLPFGIIHNKRSFVALDNLVDLVITCIGHPAAANQIFLAGDGEDVSTTELLQLIGAVLGKPARLLPIPLLLLEMCACMVGRSDVAQRLCGSLQVDISKAQKLLGWQPPVSMKDGLQKTAEWYLRKHNGSD